MKNVVFIPILSTFNQVLFHRVLQASNSGSDRSLQTCCSLREKHQSKVLQSLVSCAVEAGSPPVAVQTVFGRLKSAVIWTQAQPAMHLVEKLVHSDWIWVQDEWESLPQAEHDCMLPVRFQVSQQPAWTVVDWKVHLFTLCVTHKGLGKSSIYTA